MSWPTKEQWEELNQKVGGRLKQHTSPIKDFNDVKAKATVDNLIRQLQNPFTIEEHPWTSHSTGWHGAWETVVSPYVIEAECVDDMIAGVIFAKKHGVKLVIKSTGHDYLGRSCAPNSLMIWTHKMRGLEIHDAFVPRGGKESVPAVTIEAGCRWIEVFDFVITKNGKYIQGGGCTTVGACGGFIQGGGFGSFSKKFGSGCSSLVEAEIILASGDVVTANKYQNSDLFFALRGGGGGTWGVLTKITVRLHELPTEFGSISLNIKADSDASYAKLIREFMLFYKKTLYNPHWGEQAHFGPDRTLNISMSVVDHSKAQIGEVWAPFTKLLDDSEEYTYDIYYNAIPAQNFWDFDYRMKLKSKGVTRDLSIPGSKFFWWTSNQAEILAYWYTYVSHWLPERLLLDDFDTLVETMVKAAKKGPYQFHFNKGLGGADPTALEREVDTSINPCYKNSFALLLAASWEALKFPGIEGYEPDVEKGEDLKEKVLEAYQYFRNIAPEGGSLFTESDYFEKDWKRMCWGDHYDRLLEVKKKYDPDNFFKVHHGVGSDL
jgi:hypothetical protein